MTQTASHIDVRTIAPRERHPLIFSAFDSLAPGEALELVNDHDPRPLFYQFIGRCRANFPGTTSSRAQHLARRHHPRAGRRARHDGQCCGSCGGA